MKIVRFESAESYEPERDWKRVSLVAEEAISIEHFVKPPRHASPRHDHPAAQVLVVLDGAVSIVTDDGGEETIGKGDAAFIPGNEPHIVKNVLDVPSAGLDIFVPGRSFDFWSR